jgi:putative DNA primase/helicase
MCRCPAHNDGGRPNLQISEGRSGKVLWHCFVGCSQDAVLKALQARGLCKSKGDSQMHRANNEEAEEERERIFAAYRILRAAASNEQEPQAYFRGRGLKLMPKNACVLSAAKSGKLTDRRFPAVAFPIINNEGLSGAHVTFLTRDGEENARGEDGKSFRRTYGVVKGSYIGFGQLNGGPRPDQPLIIGEGVETTLAAMQLSGLAGIATSGTSNMASVRPPPCASLIIAADNDEPGRKAASQLAERLQAEGKQVQIAFPPVEDTDWNQRLCEAEDAETEWDEAISDVETDDDPVDALDISEFMDLTFPESELLLAPWLPKPGLVMFHAFRGNGKTYFALAVGLAVATNTALCGWKGTRGGRVLYVDGELPGNDLQLRLKTLPPIPFGQFSVLSRETFMMRKQTVPDLGTPEGRKQLDRIIRRRKPDLLILDSKTSLVRSGVENEAESWAPIQDWLMDWRGEGLCIILLHHEGKSGKPRGTSKMEDVLDTVGGLRVVEDEDYQSKGSVFELKFTKTRGFPAGDAPPLLLHFQVVDGKMQWTHQTVRDERLARISEMLELKMTHKQIADELGIKSRSRITQLVKKIKETDRAARRDGGEQTKQTDDQNKDAESR